MAELNSYGEDTIFAVKDASETRYEDFVKSKKRKGGDVVAIFVHAGAGYHSTTNEHIHLQACGDACQMAMKFLRAGASAVEAVEAAIRVLEDNEITNAGYGSNLSLDGTVEGDASIVDHYGRSGAVGAIGQVAHPIHVARLVLNGTVAGLPYRRVAPVLLTGEGALEFAYENEVPILPTDALISPAARERFGKWQRDLGEEMRSKFILTPPKPVLDPLANEAQPPTPALMTSPLKLEESSGWLSSPRDVSTSVNPGEEDEVAAFTKPQLGNLQISRGVVRCHSCARAPHMSSGSLMLPHAEIASPASPSSSQALRSSDGTTSERLAMATAPKGDGAFQELHSQARRSSSKLKSTSTQTNTFPFSTGKGKGDSRQDRITDTVGAIAIDCFGRIAAGSSSGGIGMKHKGRTGPAALVGIGTAVHPIHDGDQEHKTTAAVTSGTGEHICTTLAGQTCADQLYYGHRVGLDGSLVDTDDGEFLKDFVKDSFMGHPSVKHSHTPAAIGVLAVKKTADGLWFHFAHNTDSFALCSMTSEDEEPMALMSRAPRGGDGTQVSGGAKSCSWRPDKQGPKEIKRRKKAGHRDEGHVERLSVSRTRTRIKNALVGPSNAVAIDLTHASAEPKQKA